MAPRGPGPPPCCFRLAALAALYPTRHLHRKLYRAPHLHHIHAGSRLDGLLHVLRCCRIGHRNCHCWDDWLGITPWHESQTAVSFVDVCVGACIGWTVRPSAWPHHRIVLGNIITSASSRLAKWAVREYPTKPVEDELARAGSFRGILALLFVVIAWVEECRKAR